MKHMSTYPDLVHVWGNSSFLWNLVPSGVWYLHQQLHVTIPNCRPGVPRIIRQQKSRPFFREVNIEEDFGSR